MVVYLFSLKGLCLKLVPPSFVIIIIKNEATLPSVIYFCSADEKRFILFFLQTEGSPRLFSTYAIHNNLCIVYYIVIQYITTCSCNDCQTQNETDTHPWRKRPFFNYVDLILPIRAPTYSSVPNKRACTIINFGGKSPTYMCLFGPTGLLILKKKSHLHVYSILQAY